MVNLGWVWWVILWNVDNGGCALHVFELGIKLPLDHQIIFQGWSNFKNLKNRKIFHFSGESEQNRDPNRIRAERIVSSLSECTVGLIPILVDMYPEYYEKRDFEPPLESARARFLAQLDDGEGYQWWKLHILWLWCVSRINFEFKWLLTSFYERFPTIETTFWTRRGENINFWVTLMLVTDVRCEWPISEFGERIEKSSTWFWPTLSNCHDHKVTTTTGADNCCHQHHYDQI